jgi:hypothetical protein
MSYNSPYHLLVGVIADKIEENCRTLVSEGDMSRLDIIPEFDFSGSPVKPGSTANKVIIRPDTKIGPNRGFYDTSSALGYGPRTWAYHVEVLIEAFTVRSSKDRDRVRDITTKIGGRVMKALHELQKTPGSATTEDGHWGIMMASSPYIQGGGTSIQDAGEKRSIRGEQRLIVGFILQYLGG